MDYEKTKAIEIDGRRFTVTKMTPVTAMKVKLMVAAKILPLFEALPLQSLMATFDNVATISDEGFLESLNLDALSRALDALSKDDTLDKLFAYGLTNCFEMLPAGPARVLNPDGTYGVANIEDDPILLLRLIFEVIMHSSKGFFDGSRWTSIFKGTAGMFKQFVPTSMTASLPPSSQDIGGNTNSGTEPTT